MVKKIRLDLFISLCISMVIVGGLIKIQDRYDLSSKVFDSVYDTQEVSSTEDIAEDEVGGKATDSLLRVKTVDEVLAAKGNFTIEMTSAKLYNFGTFKGDTGVWRAVKLYDDKVVIMKINEDNIVEGDQYNMILPAGTVIYEEAEVYDDVKKTCNSYNVAQNFYIDMNGESNFFSNNNSNGFAKAVLRTFIIAIPLIAFVGLIGCTLLIHYIGVKLKLFPPIFRK